MLSSDDKSDTFETASVNSLVNFFNSSLSTENDSFSLVTSFDFVASSTWFLFSSTLFSTLMDFKILVKELISFVLASTSSCVLVEEPKYCLASATNFSADWTWETWFLFSLIRSSWTSKSDSFACNENSVTDGFFSGCSVELMVSKTVEGCSSCFSVSSIVFACSANLSSLFNSYVDSGWGCSWSSFIPISESVFSNSSLVTLVESPTPVSESFLITIAVAESASTVSTL